MALTLAQELAERERIRQTYQHQGLPRDLQKADEFVRYRTEQVATRFYDDELAAFLNGGAGPQLVTFRDSPEVLAPEAAESELQAFLDNRYGKIRS